MAKKQKEEAPKKRVVNPNVVGLHGQIVEEPITQTLENNYMPYAMSVIVSRAIPEIDGFKPSHRKLLYTMYKMGLLTGQKSKSSNIVGQTMKFNPHGDAAIYETMVRLSTGNGALLNPFIESKGNFGKVYSRDMSYAAPRYTEAKLAPICAEIFTDIDKETVEMVDNYDGTVKEPVLLPTAYPNVLVANNSGIAVGMASMICGFNLREVCETTIRYLEDPECDLLATMPAPDFPTGAEIIYDPAEMENIYRTGRGGFRMRAKWNYLAKDNIIEITEIPYTTTSEAIIEKVEELFKDGKVNKEINDIRDETDLDGLRIAIDLKRGVDPEKLMQKLFRMTTLQDTFSCNFNLLIGGNPKVLGVREILEEWCSWRIECIRGRVFYDLKKAQDKLHLLEGLEAILLDIDRAIAIIRETELEADVVPNLMMGFGIDQIQAEYVAEIRLRNINREYILKRTAEIEELTHTIADLEATLKNRRRIKSIIIKDLKRVADKFGTERKTGLVYAAEIGSAESDEPEVDNYPVTVFLSESGYFKKITAQALRMAKEQKLKEGDRFVQSFESGNAGELIFFTNRQQAYKTRLADMEDCKASSMGAYLPSLLGMDDGESVLFMLDPGDYTGDVLFAYADGKIARVSMNGYQTKTNRKKLVNAFSDKSELVSVLLLKEEQDVVCFSSDGRAIVFNSTLLQTKASKSTAGVAVLNVKGKRRLQNAELLLGAELTNISRYRAKTLPAAGAILRPEDRGEEQLTLLDSD